MERRQPMYTQHQRDKAMAEVRAGRRIMEIADDLHVADSTIRYWAKKAGVPIANRNHLTAEPIPDLVGEPVADELRRLRRENRKLRELLLQKLAAELTLEQIVMLSTRTVAVVVEGA